MRDINQDLLHADGEQETIHWSIDHDTCERLRRRAVYRYGSVEHMSVLVIDAMRDDLISEPSAEAKTHERLKGIANEYDAHVSGWEWRQRFEPEETTQLTVNVPTLLVEAFRKQHDRYGKALSECLSSLMVRRGQIQKMHDIIDTKKPITEMKVEASGESLNLSDVTLRHSVELTDEDLKTGQVGGYENRRGVLMALLRGKDAEYIERGDIQDLSKKLGAGSRPTRRKDLDAIIEQAKDSSEALEVHPTHMILSRMEHTHRLDYALNCKPSNELLKNREEYIGDLSQVALYTPDHEFPELTEWTRVIGGIREMVNELQRTAWDNQDTGKLRGLSAAVTKEETLQHIDRTLTVIKEITEARGVNVGTVLGGVSQDVTEELNSQPDSLENAWKSEQRRRRRHSEHTPKEASEDNVIQW